MNAEIFKSDRYFTVFDYIISHGQLLLRSSKNEENNINNNIDIIFFDARYIQMFVNLYGITIKFMNKKEVINYKSVNKYLSYETNNLFEVESNGEKYYIAASFVGIYENDLEFNETSLGVLKYKGREKMIAGSH